MTQHRFTDETATIAALGTLVADMRHVLRRIALACFIVGAIGSLLVGLDAASGRWFSAAITTGGATAFWFAGIETWARSRKYRGGAR